MDNLAKRGFALVNKCVLCEEDLESVDHLFLGCSFSKAVLNYLLTSFVSAWVIPASLSEALRQWSSPCTSSMFSYLWILSFHHYLWKIWKERKNRVFKENKKDVNLTYASVKSLVVENWKLMDFSNSHLPASKSQILSSWNLLPPKLSLVDKAKRPNTRWCRPP
eukprot:Gb_23591 [translate_table: standard]